VFDQEERKYIFENLKVVDKAYIEFEHLDEQNNDARPCGIIQYLAPDVMVSHEEHIPLEDEKQVDDRLQAMGSQLMNIHYGDQEQY
jgi:glycerol-3-phosphate cytidylyltransferase-like family protein